MADSTINFNPAKFAGGVAKSFVAATKTTISSYMPFTSDLMSDVENTAFDVKSYINENRPDKNSRNSSGILRMFGNKVLNTSKNFISDLSHGNLSLDRTREGLIKYIKKNTQSEFDFDFDFDFDDEENGEMPEAQAFSAEDYAQGVYESTMATIGAIEVSTNKLALMNAKSNNILGDRLIANEMVNMAQSMQMLNTINENISGVNSNLASLIEYNNTTMNDFIKNTTVHFNKVEQFMDMIAKRYEKEDEDDGEEERRKNITDNKIFDGTKIKFSNLFKKAITSADIEFAGGAGMIPALVRLGASVAFGGEDNLPKFLKEMYAGDLSMFIEAFNPAEALLENLIPGLGGLKGIDNNVKTFFATLKRKLSKSKAEGGFWDTTKKSGEFFYRLFSDEEEYKPLKGFENKETPWKTSDSDVLQNVIPKYLNDANEHLFGIRTGIEALVNMVENISTNNIRTDAHLLDFHYDVIKHYERSASELERNDLQGTLKRLNYTKRSTRASWGKTKRGQRAYLDDRDIRINDYKEINDLIYDPTTGSLSVRKDILKRVEDAEKRAYGTGLQAFTNLVSSYIVGDKDGAAVIDSSFEDWANENKNGKASKARKDAYEAATKTFNEFNEKYQLLTQQVWHSDKTEIDADDTLQQIKKLLADYNIEDALSTYQENELYSQLMTQSDNRKREILNYQRALSGDVAALRALNINNDELYKVRDGKRNENRAKNAGIEYDAFNSSLRNNKEMFKVFAYAALEDAVRSGQVTKDDAAYKELKDDCERRYQGMVDTYDKKMAISAPKNKASRNYANYALSAAIDTMLEFTSDVTQEFRNSGIKAVGHKFKEFTPLMFFTDARDTMNDYSDSGHYQIRYDENGNAIEYYIYSKKRDDWGKRIKVDKHGKGTLEDDPDFQEIWDKNIKDGYDQVDDEDFRQFRYKTTKELKEEQEKSTKEGLLHSIQSVLGWTDDDDKVYAPQQYKQPRTIGLFATGATRIDRDQIARVHEGEMILDRSLSQKVRDDVATMLNNGGYNAMTEDQQKDLIKAIGESDERFRGHEMEVIKAINRVADQYDENTIKQMGLRPSDESVCFIDIDEEDTYSSLIAKKLTEIAINLGIVTQSTLGTTERENTERGFDKAGKAKDFLLGDKGEGDLRQGGLLSNAYNKIVDDIRYKRFMYIDGKSYTGYNRDEAGNIIEGSGLHKYNKTGENATETKNIMDEVSKQARENAEAYADSKGWTGDQKKAYINTVDRLVKGIPGAVKGGLIGLTLSGILGSAIGIVGGFTLGNEETREYIFGKVETDSNGRKYVVGGVFGGFTNKLIEAGEDIKLNFKTAFKDVTNNLKLGFKSFFNRLTNSDNGSVTEGIAKFLDQVITGKDGSFVTKFLNSLKNTAGKVAEGATDIAIDAVTIGSKLMFNAASVPFNLFASIIGGKEYRTEKRKQKRDLKVKRLKDAYEELVKNNARIGISENLDVTRAFPAIGKAIVGAKDSVVSGWKLWRENLANENETYKRLGRTRHLIGKGGIIRDTISQKFTPLAQFGEAMSDTVGGVGGKTKTIFDKINEGISNLNTSITGDFGQNALRGLFGAILAAPLAMTGHPILAGSLVATSIGSALAKQIFGTGIVGAFATGLKAIGTRVAHKFKRVGEFFGNKVHFVKRSLGMSDGKFYFNRMTNGSQIEDAGMLGDLGYTPEEQQRYFELKGKDPSELSQDDKIFINDIEQSVSAGYRIGGDDSKQMFADNAEYQQLIQTSKTRALNNDEKKRFNELRRGIAGRRWSKFKRDHGLNQFSLKFGRGKKALDKLGNISLNDFNNAKASLDYNSSLTTRLTPEMFASMGAVTEKDQKAAQEHVNKKLAKLRDAIIKKYGSIEAAMDHPDELKAMILSSGLNKNETAVKNASAEELGAFVRNGDSASVLQTQNFQATVTDLVTTASNTLNEILDGLKKTFFDKTPKSGDVFHSNEKNPEEEEQKLATERYEELLVQLKDSNGFLSTIISNDKLTFEQTEKLQEKFDSLKDKINENNDNKFSFNMPGFDLPGTLPGSVDIDEALDSAKQHMNLDFGSGSSASLNKYDMISGFATGATNIDRDGIYKLHKGEVVLDPETSNIFRRNFGAGGFDSNALNGINESLKILTGRGVGGKKKLFSLFGNDGTEDPNDKEGGIKGIFTTMKDKLSGLLTVFTGDKTGSEEEKKSFLDKIGESFAGVGTKISNSVMGSGLIPLKPDGTIDKAKIAARLIALLGGALIFGPTILKLIDKIAPLLQPVFDTIKTTITPLIFGVDGEGGLINGIGTVINDVIRTVSGAKEGESTIHAIGRGIWEAWQKSGGIIYENTPEGKKHKAVDEDRTPITNNERLVDITKQVESEVGASGITGELKDKYYKEIMETQAMFMQQVSTYYSHIVSLGTKYIEARAGASESEFTKTASNLTNVPVIGIFAQGIEDATNYSMNEWKKCFTDAEFAYVEKYGTYTTYGSMWDKAPFAIVVSLLTNVKIGYNEETKSWYIQEYASKDDAEHFSSGFASKIKQGYSILVRRNNRLDKAMNSILSAVKPSIYAPAKSYPELKQDEDVDLNAYGNAVGYGFTQNDPRWSRQSYGSFKSGRGSTIGSGGCGPTAMANVYSNLTGKNMNPAQMARFSQMNGYNAQGGTSAGLFTNGARKLGLASRAISKSGNAISNSIRRGNNVVIAGKNGPYTRSGHIMSVRGVDSRGNAIVDDPLKRGARRIPMNRLTKGMTHAWSIGYGRHVGDANSPYSTWDDELIDGDVTFNRNGGAFGYTSSLPEGCVYNSFVNGYLNSIISGNVKFSDIAASFSPTSLRRQYPEVNNKNNQVIYENAYKRLVEIFGIDVPWRESNYDFAGADGAIYSGNMGDFFRLLYNNLSAGNPILFSSNNGTSIKMRDIISRNAKVDSKGNPIYTSNSQHGVLLAGLYRNSAGEEFVVVDNPNTGTTFNGKSNQIYTVPMATFKNAVENAVYPDIRRVVIFGKNAVRPASRKFVKQNPEDLFKAMKAGAASSTEAYNTFITEFPDGNKYDSYTAWASAHPDLALAKSNGTFSTSNTTTFTASTTGSSGYSPIAANYDSSGIFSSGLNQNINAGGTEDKNASTFAEWIGNIVSDLAEFGTNLIGTILTGDKSNLFATKRNAYLDKLNGGYSSGGASGYSGGSYSYSTGSTGGGQITAETVLTAKFIESILESAADTYHNNADINDEIKSLFNSDCTIDYSKLHGEMQNDPYYNNMLTAIANSDNYKRYASRVSTHIYTWILARHVMKYPTLNNNNAVIVNRTDRDAAIIYNKLKDSNLGFSSIIASQLNGTSINGLVAPTSSLSGYNALPSWAKAPHGEFKLYDMSFVPDAATVHDYTSAIATIGETGTKFPPTNAEEISRMYFRIYEDNGAPSFGRRGFHFNPSNYGISSPANYYPGEAIFANLINSGIPSVSEQAQKWFDYITAPGNFHNFPTYPRYTEITGDNDFLSALIQAEDAMNTHLHSEYFNLIHDKNPNITDPRIYVLGGDISGVSPNPVASKLAGVTTLEEARRALSGYGSRVDGVYGMITTGQGQMYKTNWTFPPYPMMSIGNGDAGYNMRDNLNMYTNDVYMGDADNPMHVVMNSDPITSRMDKLIELIDTAVNPKETTTAGTSNAKSNSIGHGNPTPKQTVISPTTKGESSVGQKDRLAMLHMKLAKRTRAGLNYNQL